MDFLAYFLGVWLIFWAAVMIIIIAACWKVFEKAGQPGWAAIIPIYNTYVLLQIVGKPTWWLILYFIPFVNVVFGIWTVNMLSKSFGKDEGFTIGLLILGMIFYPILGFGSARYIGPYGNPDAFKAAQNPQFDFDQHK